MRENAVDTISSNELGNVGDTKEKIYHVLKRMIMKREFTPNERLDAYEIANKLGVSRTPVRDALNMLDGEGFIKTMPRKGTFVAGIYRDDLVQIFQYREMIELFCLDSGFSNLVQAVPAFEQIIDNWDREIQKKEYEGSIIMESDVQIHKLIVQSAGNPRIVKSYESLNCHVQTARGYYLQDRERIDASQAEHKAILHAIVHNDKDLASRMLKEHLNQTLNSLIRMIDVFKVF
ncbi:GntR family transcriptional regulator [Paenibacillus eucommiae]|uniref:DNA-binding GntR family transcriptional regulator n=1 Tax=Paenibacillus eucommiae TaxID=1355755 RepID=A0ABS4IRH1_9BACL|nr:GntR family transcriptional regulator [Paenibacillus eucommiae]MBP1990172.1 DNA-binding GntR family transcriptional regulator [Paenibacillus eucommiae]